MADRTNGAAADEERAATRRVVLREERVLVLPEGTDTVDEKKLREALGLKPTGGPKIVTSPAWIVVGEFEGGSKDRAIRAHAGEPGTPDAKPGVYKAPSTTAWKGGRRYLPPVQRVLAEDID